MKRLISLAVAAASLLAGPTLAQQQAPAAAAPDKTAVEKIIRDYLMEHPEVVIEAVNEFKRRMEVQERRAAETAVKDRAQEIFNDPDSPVGGNPKGDVTVVEFFDYRCGVCKRAHPEVAELVASDKGIRMVYKEWPILGTESVFAARAALASRPQGRYLAFHNALMEARGSLDPAAVFAIAAGAGLDVNRLRKDINDPKIEAAIRKNYALAEALKIDGTPSFLIGNTLLKGARDLATMRQLVARARKGG
jgi:protein-disulfide isomerase